MARTSKPKSRKELRREAEAAEALEKSKHSAESKPPAKPKSRSKAAKEVRIKAFWGVFNPAMKRVALYEYADRKAAEQKAKELTASQKTPHFVSPVKEEISE
ncbi:MAG: hypothetical protein K6T86_07230 [Pirellulales bacterium]|nr:hypothetical protein [Pirellulales bacterium]